MAKTLTLNHITYKGRDIPCRQTMGAMLRFKEATGREASEMDETSMTDIMTFLFCCVQSACNADKIEFSDTLMDFADNIEPAKLTEWFNEQAKETAARVPSGPPASKKK